LRTPKGEVVETRLLLLARQAVALERLGRRRGMTVGELLRAADRDTLRGAAAYQLEES
jgi:hypothetical protein